MKSNFIFIFCLLLSLGIKSNAQLYTETGTNPSFADLNLPEGKVSLGPIDGSIIDVNNSLVETGANGNQPIISGIILQTICNTNIPRDNFTNYKRWYQEDGNTQIFRMFEDEVSLLDSRGEHPRNEVLTTTKWKTGAWQEWNGRYTVIAPPNGGAAIFQIFNQDFQWPMQLVIRTSGALDLRYRSTASGDIGPEQTFRLLNNVLSNGFDVKIRDNGYNYECYINGILRHSGIFNRPTGNTYFKWGMYASPTQTLNSLMFVTGATLSSETATNILPTVSLTSPDSNANIPVGQITTISANAWDPDGTISKVNFRVNGNYQGQDLTSPYTFAWTPSATGTYTIDARAYDNTGASIISASRTVTVVNQTTASLSLANNAKLKIGINETVSDESKSIDAKIYPNPLEGSSIVIETSSDAGKILELRVLDSRGIMKYQFSNVRSGEAINLPNLGQGIFFMHITCENGVVIKKLLKLP